MRHFGTPARVTKETQMFLYHVWSNSTKRKPGVQETSLVVMKPPVTYARTNLNLSKCFERSPVSVKWRKAKEHGQHVHACARCDWYWDYAKCCNLTRGWETLKWYAEIIANRKTRKAKQSLYSENCSYVRDFSNCDKPDSFLTIVSLRASRKQDLIKWRAYNTGHCVPAAARNSETGNL